MADGSDAVSSSAMAGILQPPSGSTLDATTALALNRNVGKLVDMSSASSDAVVAAINSVTNAVINSLIGGTTGSTANALLRAKGTGGRALKNSVIVCDDSGNLTGVGNITGGSLNGVTLATASPTKTLTVNVNITLAGTNGTTMTFPSSNANVAALNIADQSLSGGANVTSKSLSTGSITIDCGACPLQYITNGGNFTITAPANDGSCILLITNNASAGTVSFSGFSVGSNVGDAFTTTNGNKFFVTIVRINGTSTYAVKAAQ